VKRWPWNSPLVTAEEVKDGELCMQSRTIDLEAGAQEEEKQAWDAGLLTDVPDDEDECV